jgi:hypothetical protein
MKGKWVVMYGVIPDRVIITLNTNRLVELSGHKDQKDWKKIGEWRMVSDKLVLFLEQDDIPSFVFRKGRRYFIVDPGPRPSCQN